MGEGRGNAFITFLKKGREEIAVGAGNSGENSGPSEETIPEGQAGSWVQVHSGCESHREKMIGKPYSGKLNVRFDEGELEIELRLLRQFPTLPIPAWNFRNMSIS